MAANDWNNLGDPIAPYNPIDPIDSQFEKIWKIAGPSNNKTTAQSQIKSEPLQGNSLIQFLRSLNNFTGGQGASSLEQGRDVFGGGIQAFQQPFDYYSKILSGDRNATAAYLAPQTKMIDDQFAAATKASEQNMPMGGYRSQRLADLPFEKAGIVSQGILNAQPQAAQQLSQMAQTLASLGLNQQQIAAALLSMTGQHQLGVRGQDVAEGGQWKQMLGDIAQGAGQIAGAAIYKSDRRLKTDIELVGEENGHKTYRFRYFGDDRKFIGVMADDVLKKDQEAVSVDDDGFLCVDYGRIGVRLREAA